MREKILLPAQRQTRRGLLTGGLAVSALLVVRPRFALGQSVFRHVVDLSHTINDVTTGGAGGGTAPFSMEAVRTFDKDKMNINRWTLIEHNGTHIDAPLHFSANGTSLEAIPIEDLVVPLALIDLSRRAVDNPDTAVTPDDIKAWEAANGPLPKGCCVVMNSGWGKYYGTPRYNGRGADGKGHVPGFHIETAHLLMSERSVKGIGVDTASLDQGVEAGKYPVHNAWLPSGRWGLEGLANLDTVPAHGATIVVGALKVKGATGGPARVMALY